MHKHIRTQHRKLPFFFYSIHACILISFGREPSEIAPSEAGDEYDNSRRLSANDLFIKDAFLVFRALCKLTMKPLNSER